MPPEQDPTPPRLAQDLLVAPVALDDEALWDGHEVSGTFAGTTAAHVDVTGCRLTGAVFTGAAIDRLRLVDTVVEDCELSGLVLTRSALNRVEFRRCRMSGLIASGAELTDVLFADCKLDDANLRMTTWERSLLDGCVMTGSDFQEANLTTTRFGGCDLTGVNFTKVRLSGVSLAGSTLTDIGGADSLRGVTITGEQVVPLAFAMFATMGIRIDPGGTLS
jgi:uncharacterized protein YjbI with pentapeptide repeats